MSTNLTLTITLATPVIPVTGQMRLAYALVEIGGGETSQTLPVNLGLILDSSDSMRIRLVTDTQFARLAQSGQAVEVLTDGVPAWQITSSPEVIGQFPCRLDFVRQALFVARDHLRSQDRYTVVAFAAQAVTVIPATSGRERQRLTQAAEHLDQYQLGDETHMAEGLALGLLETQRDRPPGATSRLVVLTDGFTRNAGECYALAKRAREQGVMVSTLGLGTEFNEELLIPLAEMTGGNAYYIETPEQLPDAFRRELGSALAVTCQNVEVKLRLASSVELRRVHRVLPTVGAFDPGPNQDGSYALYLGDYEASAPPALLLELLLPSWGAGTYQAAQAMLTWDDPAGSLVRGTVRQEIIIQLSAEGGTQTETRVMKLVDKVGAYKLGTRALEDATRGEPGAATLKLRRVATQLLDMGEPGLAEEMMRQAQALEQRGQLDPNVTKKLRYETRRITQRLDG